MPTNAKTIHEAVYKVNMLVLVIGSSIDKSKSNRSVTNNTTILDLRIAHQGCFKYCSIVVRMSLVAYDRGKHTVRGERHRQIQVPAHCYMKMLGIAKYLVAVHYNICADV